MSDTQQTMQEFLSNPAMKKILTGAYQFGQTLTSGTSAFNIPTPTAAVASLFQGAEFTNIYSNLLRGIDFILPGIGTVLGGFTEGFFGQEFYQMNKGQLLQEYMRGLKETQSRLLLDSLIPKYGLNVRNLYSEVVSEQEKHLADIQASKTYDGPTIKYMSIEERFDLYYRHIPTLKQLHFEYTNTLEDNPYIFMDESMKTYGGLKGYEQLKNLSFSEFYFGLYLPFFYPFAKEPFPEELRLDSPLRADVNIYNYADVYNVIEGKNILSDFEVELYEYFLPLINQKKESEMLVNPTMSFVISTEEFERLKTQQWTDQNYADIITYLIYNDLPFTDPNKAYNFITTRPELFSPALLAMMATGVQDIQPETLQQKISRIFTQNKTMFLVVGGIIIFILLKGVKK